MKGLYAKYVVFKVNDDKTVQDEPLTNVFVLSPETDPVARKALAFYADMSDNTKLRHDIWRWLGNLRKSAQASAEPLTVESLRVALDEAENEPLRPDFYEDGPEMRRALGIFPMHEGGRE